MKEIAVISVLALVALAVISYNLAEGHEVYRECLATQERIATINPEFSGIGCYR